MRAALGDWNVTGWFGAGTRGISVLIKDGNHRYDLGRRLIVHFEHHFIECLHGHLEPRAVDVVH